MVDAGWLMRFRAPTSVVRSSPTGLSGVGRILVASLLRDMRTRFGRSHWSYLIVVGWPLSHLVTMLGGYVIFHKIAPVGGDPTVYAMTGMLPYILCLYPARLMTFAVFQSQQLLQFPIVKPIHLVFSRAILEIMNCLIVLLIFVTGCLVIGVDLYPLDLYDAAAGCAAIIFLGIGMGLMNVAMFAVFGVTAVIIFVLFMIALYLCSGAIIPIEFVAPDWLEVASYNPLFQLVQWLRHAFYGGDDYLLSRSYLICFAAVCFAIGLLGERLLRGRMFR